MPTYKNESSRAITIKNEDGEDFVVNPNQTFTSKISHPNKEFEEVDKFPYYSPVVKEIKDISGVLDDVIKVPVYATADTWEIINNSSSDIELHYDDVEAEGLTIFAGSSLRLTDGDIKEVNNFVFKLDGTININELIVNQFR